MTCHFVVVTDQLGQVILVQLVLVAANAFPVNHSCFTSIYMQS